MEEHGDADEMKFRGAWVSAAGTSSLPDHGTRSRRVQFDPDAASVFSPPLTNGSAPLAAGPPCTTESCFKPSQKLSTCQQSTKKTPNMAPPSKLAVSTSSVVRLVKEEASYHKELEQQQARIQQLENSTSDENAEYQLKQEVWSWKSCSNFKKINMEPILTNL